MTISAEQVGDRIHVTGWIGDNTNKRLERIPGCGFDKYRTKATYPLNWRTCLNLRAEFGGKLSIGPDLTEWSWDEYDRRERLREIALEGSKTLPRLARTAPKTFRRVSGRAWQPTGVAWLSEARRGVLGDTPGLGKTVQSIAAMVESEVRGPILVLAPTVSLRNVWLPEIQQWAPNDRVVAVGGTRKQREKSIGDYLAAVQKEPKRRHWILCNYHMLRLENATRDAHGSRVPGATRMWPFLFDMDWEGIICDEGQRYLLTRTSKAKDQSSQRSGAGKLIVANNGFKLVLSGTPFRGRPENYWGILNWLWPKNYPGYWSWVEQYFEILDDGMGSLLVEIADSKRADWDEDLDATMLRRTDTEVRPDRPDRVYPGYPLKLDKPNSPHKIWLEMEPKQARAYDDMRRMAEVRLDSGLLIGNGVLSELTRLRQFASSYCDLREVKRNTRDGMMIEDVVFPIMPSNKYDWLLDWLDDRGIVNDEDGDCKIVVASQYTKLLKMFHEQLAKDKVKTELIIGGQPQANYNNIERFMHPQHPLRVLLINTHSGGESITLDIADEMVILDDTWIPDDTEQLERRIDRPAGRDKKLGATYWHVRTRGTIEEHIANLNQDRADLQHELLDGRRGVGLAKRMVEGI